MRIFLTNNLFIFCVFTISQSFGCKYAKIQLFLYVADSQYFMRILRRMRWKFMSSYGKYHCFKSAIYMLLLDNNLRIGYQTDALDEGRPMLLGYGPIFLARNSQVYILFAYRFFLNWKFVSAVFRAFFGKKRRRYAYCNV